MFSQDVGIGSLRLVVQRALESASSRTILCALVEVDPLQGAMWLLKEESVARGWGADLPPMLHRVCEMALARKCNPLDLIPLIQSYSDVIGAATVASLVWAIPGKDRDNRLKQLLIEALQRFPLHPGLLRVASEIAAAHGDVTQGHAFLTSLCQVDPSPAAINWAYRARSTLSPLDQPSARIALLSSFTIDPLLPHVDAEVRALGLQPLFYVTPFNSWGQEAVDERSGLHQFRPDIAFLSVSIDDLVPELSHCPSSALLEEKGRLVVDRMVNIIRSFTSVTDAHLIVHGFYSVYRRNTSRGLEKTVGDVGKWIVDLNRQLEEQCHQTPRVHFLDMQDLLLHRNEGRLDSPKMRYLARMRFSDAVLAEVARAYARYIAPLKGIRRKCIVVDLDNTLWGGIVGEDGPHGIKLGDTSPGAEYQDFQRYLLSLTQRGFLLAINSKNNHADAMEVIRSHDGMVLREDSFSAMRINWSPKPDNILSLAKELNIGVDSMVFLDDNPHERALMRQALPDVLTPELPSDPALYRHMVEMLPQLQTLIVTEEDKNRVQEYRSKRQRDEVRATAQSVEAYLRDLAIVAEVTQVSEKTLARVHQLFHRTNQFNLTTRRYDEATLAGFMKDENSRLFALRARDRFGDHGLVATALVRGGGDCWVIDSLLMSCRVIGYGIETALLAVIVEDARHASAAAIVGEYIATKKNQPARDFYERHGFSREGIDAGTVRWRLNMSDASVAVPAWIEMEVTNAA